MKRINSYAELKAAVEEYKPLLNLRKKDSSDGVPTKREILVCGDTGCASSGSIKVLEALEDEIKKAGGFAMILYPNQFDNFKKFIKLLKNVIDSNKMLLYNNIEIWKGVREWNTATAG